MHFLMEIPINAIFTHYGGLSVKRNDSISSGWPFLRSITCLVFALTMAWVPVAQADGKQSVIMQVSEKNPATWNLALNIANNLKQTFGKNGVDVEIVAFGPGIDMLKIDSEVGHRLTKAETAGVHLRACGQAMKALKISDKDLHPSVQIVTGGVIEIMEKVKDGWIYIRP